MTKQKAEPARGARKPKRDPKPSRRAKQPADDRPSKKATCLALLERADGASIAELQKATGWQAHSVRGFLAGAVKKMPGVSLESVKSASGPRRYRLRPAP